MVRIQAGMRRSAAFLVLTALLVGLSVVPLAEVEADELTVTRVDDPEPDGCAVNGCSLREAVMAANQNAGQDDHIVLPPGTFTLSALDHLGFEYLEVTDQGGSLTVVGAGAGETFITKEVAAKGFFLVGEGAELRLEGLEIVGTGDGSNFSMGVFNIGGVVRIVDSLLTNHNFSGVRNWRGATFITDTTISGGVSGLGGAVYNGPGLLEVSRSVLADNVADGGGIYNDGGTVSVSGSTITGNQGPGGGGGIYNQGGTVHLSGTTVDGNFGAQGGGIYNAGVLTIEGGSVSNNEAFASGGIHNEVSLDVDGATIAGNVGAAEAGGVYSDGPATLRLTVVAGNSTSGDAGGIFNFDSMDLVDSTVRDNQAPDGNGGGIRNVGPLTVTASTISGNHARWGGGLSHEGASLTTFNSTLSGNSAEAMGGGIYVLGGDPPSLHHTTITANTAAFGAGVSSAAATVRASIVAGNDAALEGDDCWGTLTSAGYNLVGTDDACHFTVDPDGSDLVGSGGAVVDPLLGTLAGNGGPTSTHALLGGSPAVNAIPGVHCEAATDQRAAPRADGGCDIGSFEVQDTVLPVIGAALVPAGAVGPNDGTFQVDFSCTDNYDPTPAVSASLNGVPVEAGEIVKLKKAKDYRVKSVRNGRLFMLGPHFELHVTCVDVHGNQSTATAVPEFA